MATDNTDTTLSINLEEDPELSYFTWKVQVEDVASNAATVVESTGLLTLILKDPAWEAYPPNRTTLGLGLGLGLRLRLRHYTCCPKACDPSTCANHSRHVECSDQCGEVQQRSL